eukprot:15326810-Ditylum_brightwellii.AAC.1
MVLPKVLTIVTTVLISTSHTSHKQLIVVWQREARRTSIDDNSDDSADKHLTHLSQAVDCCLTKRSKQNKHINGNKDDGVDNGVDNSDDIADKHLTYLSQADDCCLPKRSKQNRH